MVVILNSDISHHVQTGRMLPKPQLTRNHYRDLQLFCKHATLIQTTHDYNTIKRIHIQDSNQTVLRHPIPSNIGLAGAADPEPVVWVPIAACALLGYAIQTQWI